MKTTIISLLLVCMMVSADCSRSLKEASPPENRRQDREDVQSGGRRGHHHPPSRHHSPRRQHSPPPPLHHSSPAPRPRSGDFNDPGKCEMALAIVDNCVAELISFYFGTNNTIEQPCCSRIEQLSQPCFGRAFIDDASYYNKVTKFCS